MVSGELFKDLRLTSYYKYLLYLFGIILILSFFLDVKNIDVYLLRRVALWIIAGGLGIWLIEEIFEKINMMIYEYYLRRDINRYYKVSSWLISLLLLVHVCILLVIVFNFYKLV